MAPFYYSVTPLYKDARAAQPYSCAGNHKKERNVITCALTQSRITHTHAHTQRLLCTPQGFRLSCRMAVAQRRSRIPGAVRAGAEPRTPAHSARSVSGACFGRWAASRHARDHTNATSGEALAGTAVDGPGTRPAASQEQPNRNAPERKTGNHGGHEESSVTRDAVRPWTAANQGSRAGRVGRRPILRGPAPQPPGVGHHFTATAQRFSGEQAGANASTDGAAFLLPIVPILGARCSRLIFFFFSYKNYLARQPVLLAHSTPSQRRNEQGVLVTKK